MEFSPPPGMTSSGKPRAGLLEMDAGFAFFVERHGSLSLPGVVTRTRVSASRARIRDAMRKPAEFLEPF